MPGRIEEKHKTELVLITDATEHVLPNTKQTLTLPRKTELEEKHKTEHSVLTNNNLSDKFK